jgi:hypothetical protein
LGVGHLPRGIALRWLRFVWAEVEPHPCFPQEFGADEGGRIVSPRSL